MEQIILQYVLVVVLVIALGYLMYLLKDKGSKFNEDYYGITYSVFSSLKSAEEAEENTKKVLRIVSNAVNYVEENYKDEENKIKEDKALEISKEALSKLDLDVEIRDSIIRNIIRIGSAMMLPKNN